MGEPEDIALTPQGQRHDGSTSPPQYQNRSGGFDHFSKSSAPLSPSRYADHEEEEGDYSMGEEGGSEDDHQHYEESDEENSDYDHATGKSDEEYSRPPARNDVLQVETPFPNYRHTPTLLAFYDTEGENY